MVLAVVYQESTLFLDFAHHLIHNRCTTFKKPVLLPSSIGRNQEMHIAIFIVKDFFVNNPSEIKNYFLHVILPCH
jgi:hypothetical protein